MYERVMILSLALLTFVNINNIILISRDLKGREGKTKVWGVIHIITVITYTLMMYWLVIKVSRLKGV